MQSLDLDVLQSARDWRRAGRRVWLLTVAQTFGASPRPPGSLAVIRDDGILVGSVSGGCIEDDLVARREEYTTRKPAFAAYGVTAEEARRFGLPCGGELEVIIEPDVAIESIEGLLERIAHGHIVARHVDHAVERGPKAEGEQHHRVGPDGGSRGAFDHAAVVVGLVHVGHKFHGRIFYFRSVVDHHRVDAGNRLVAGPRNGRAAQQRIELRRLGLVKTNGCRDGQ